jgi:hypothetical protein
MKDQTPVERAAGLYATALQESRGKTCSDNHYNVVSKQEALDAVSELLILEGRSPAEAALLAKAGKLLADARRRSLVG